MFKKSIISLACCQALTMPAMVFAEGDSDTGASSLSLGEMVVTTRKREETLQKVPIAITAFSAELIEDADLQSIEDIAFLTPGFTFTQLFGNTGNPVIRGASTTIGEPNVGFFLDGVYQDSRGSMEAMFGDDLERIEVAKGPQSALYGRNTFAGAINYVTKQPGNESEGKLEVTLGNEGRKDARFSHSGAITEDTLFYRVGGMHSSFDGFYKNEFDGSNLDDKQSNVYSLSLVALPTDSLEMVFRIGVENTNDGDDAVRFVDNNILPFSVTHPVFGPLPVVNQLFTGDLPSFTNGFSVTPGHNQRDNASTSLRLDWDLDNFTFTSITGYNDLEIDSAIDSDYSTAGIGLGSSPQFIDADTEQREFSQEFRLTSVDQPIRWMAGIYFYDLDRDIDTTVTGHNAGVIATEESTRNWAGFGSLGFDLTDQLALTLSGRYSSERKETKLDVVGVPANFDENETFNNFTPKIALDYQVTDNAMVYASVAKAVKSGGFNTAIAGNVPLPNERSYDEEKSLNYEIGIKSSWLDNRLTANLALFYIDWEDQIVRALGAGNALLNANAGESSSRGFELELAAKPAENWDVMVGLSYTDAQYDDYTFGALPAFGMNANLDGNPLQFVSEWTANASVQYVKPFAIADFNWKSRVDVVYQDEQAGQAVGDIGVIPDRTIVNLRTGIENDKYALKVWVKNLFDDDEALNVVVIPNTHNQFAGFQGLVGAPVERTYGVTASVKF